MTFPSRSMLLCTACKHELLVHGITGCNIAECSCPITYGDTQSTNPNKHYYILHRTDIKVAMRLTKQEAIDEIMRHTKTHKEPFVLAVHVGSTKLGEPTFEEQG